MSKLIAGLMLLVICCSFVLSISANKKVVYNCQDTERKGNFCTMIYFPVCGYRPDIACLKAPCHHVTYGNSCQACHDEYVQSYTTGECEYLD